MYRTFKVYSIITHRDAKIGESHDQTSDIMLWWNGFDMFLAIKVMGGSQTKIVFLVCLFKSKSRLKSNQKRLIIDW